jgi:hypothetical protein
MSFYYKGLADGTYCLTSYNGNATHVTFPENITISILGDKLFKNRTEIESIDIPETVTQIGGWVFDGCVNLKTLKLPPQLTDMWQYALTRMSIEEIEVPSSLKAIIPFTFNECKSLKRVVINKGTHTINAWAFKNCEQLEEVILPKEINIHENAFSGCPNVIIIKK